MHQRLGQPGKSAQVIVDAQRATASRSAWERLLLGYYAGAVSRNELFNNAHADWQKCEAAYYIGEKLLHETGSTEARVWFERCLGTEVNFFNEYHLSSLRLRQLRREVDEE